MRYYLMLLYSLVVPAILLSLMGTANASSSQDNLTMKEEVALQEVETADGREGILAKIIIPAPLEVVWAVITDYEKLSDFIADPKFYAPGWVVRYMLKRDIPVRLKALRERILKINSLQ